MTLAVNREQLRGLLAGLDLTGRSAEVVARQRMLDLLDCEPRCFFRDSFPAHFTGAALVLSADRQRTLLTHHRKLGRWLQFGGHCDGEEDVLATAQREAREESGLQGLVVAAEQPVDLDIHPIPAYGEEPAHEHFDLRWILIAPEDAIPICSDESYELRWFTPSEVRALPGDGGLHRLVDKWEAFRDERSSS